MRKSLLKKLGNYSALASTTVIASTSLKADIIYKDINPDVLVTAGNSFSFDINGDTIGDFNFQVNSGSNFKSAFIVGNYSYSNSILAYQNIVSSSTYYYGSALSNNMTIGVNNSFYSSAFLGGTYSSSTFGQFNNSIDKYVGLKFNVNGNTHYAWTRIGLKTGDSLLIKDFAYESVNGDSILAGNVAQIDTVTNVTAIDNGDNANVSDILVTFNTLDDETYVDEYRIIAVKSADALSFNLTSAESVPNGNYQSIAVDTSLSVIQRALPVAFRDKDGATLVAEDDYQIFILSISSYPDKNILVNSENTLSVSSGDVSFNNVLKLSGKLKNDIKITNDRNEILIKSKFQLNQMSINLVDMNGKSVINSSLNSNYERIDISKINSGLYILNLQSENEMISKKIVK